MLDYMLDMFALKNLLTLLALLVQLLRIVLFDMFALITLLRVLFALLVMRKTFSALKSQSAQETRNVLSTLTVTVQQFWRIMFFLFFFLDNLTNPASPKPHPASPEICPALPEHLEFCLARFKPDSVLTLHSIAAFQQEIQDRLLLWLARLEKGALLQSIILALPPVLRISYWLCLLSGYWVILGPPLGFKTCFISWV